jgi:hypothetical protein
LAFNAFLRLGEILVRSPKEGGSVIQKQDVTIAELFKLSAGVLVFPLGSDSAKEQLVWPSERSATMLDFPAMFCTHGI